MGHASELHGEMGPARRCHRRSRTYRGQRPTNWYIAILIIVVVGLASVIFARYQYQNPASASAANEPTVGTTWHAGFDYYVCGTQEPALPAAKSGNAGIITTGNGVMQIAPKTSARPAPMPRSGASSRTHPVPS